MAGPRSWGNRSHRGKHSTRDPRHPGSWNRQSVRPESLHDRFQTDERRRSRRSGPGWFELSKIISPEHRFQDQVVEAREGMIVIRLGPRIADGRLIKLLETRMLNVRSV